MNEPNAVNRRRCRPFTLIDGMILVAVTAVSFCHVRATGDGPLGWPHAMDPRLNLSNRIYIFLGIFAPILLAWTPAWLILRLRGPRPSLRRINRQPGQLTCLAATMAGIVQELESVAKCYRYQRPIVTWSWPLSFIYPVFFAILGSWVVITLSGFFRREPGWIDATGIALGAGWVALAIGTTTAQLVST